MLINLKVYLMGYFWDLRYDEAIFSAECWNPFEYTFWLAYSNCAFLFLNDVVDWMFKALWLPVLILILICVIFLLNQELEAEDGGAEELEKMMQLRMKSLTSRTW